MRNTNKLVGVVVAGLLGLGTGVVAAGAGDSNDADLSEKMKLIRKQANLQDLELADLYSDGNEISAEELSSELFTTPKRLEDFEDSGPIQDIEHIRTIVTSLLEDEAGASAVDAETVVRENPDDNLTRKERARNEQLNLADEVEEERTESLENVWAKDIDVHESMVAIQENITSMLNDSQDTQSAFTDNKFVLTQIEGVKVSGDSAYVQLIGHQSYRMLDGSLENDPSAQYAVTLERAPGSTYGWLLIERNYTPLSAFGG